ncbi:MAG: hypothetical protein V1799_16385 [bacterium]
MRKLSLIILMLLPFMISTAQYQDEFYNNGTAIGVCYTSIGHNMTPVRGKVTTSDGERPYKSSGSMFGFTLFTEWNQTGAWKYNWSYKSHFIDDFVAILQAIKNMNDANKEASPWFYCFLEANNGLNVYYDRSTRVAAGLSFNIFQLEFWASNGEYNAQRGLYFNFGPYVNGDYMLSNDLLLKMGFSTTFPVSGVKGAKKPVFINFTPGIMMNNGLYFGIDYTIISGLEDSAPGKTGTSLSGSRFELKFALFTDIL